jgi:Phage integrase family
VLLLLELGLRVSEAVGADIEDLGEQGRHRVLKLKGKGQTTKAAVAPLNAAVAHAVDRAKGARTKGPLLVTSTGERLTRQHAGKLIKRMGEQIGIPDLHPHALRHGFVTLSLDEGASLRDVQDAARHADPRTTRRYDKNRNSLNRHPTHGSSAHSSPSGRRILWPMTVPIRTPRSIGVDAATLSRWRSRGLLSARKLEGVRLRPSFDEAARADVPCAVPPLTCNGEDVVAVKARHLD